MNTKEAVAKRVIELCNEKNIAINALANISGVSPSTVLQHAKREKPKPGCCFLEKAM